MERENKFTRVNKWVLFAVLCLVLASSGCATMSKPEPPEEPEQSENLEPEPQKMPDMEALAEIEPEAAMEEEMPFESKLFSLNVMQAELQEAVMPMAEAAGLNLVFDEDVDVNAPVSASFTDLPLKEAMELVLGSHGYYYKVDGNVLRVKAMETRVFQVEHSLVSSTGSSDLSGESYDVNTEIEEDDVKVWEAIEDALGTGDGGGGSSGQQENTLISNVGSVQVNKMAGVIVVNDRPRNIKRVGEYLEQLENALRRQVLIEARLVEVTLKDSHSYGINWSQIGATLGDGWNVTPFDFDTGGPSADDSSFIVGLDRDQGDGNAMGYEAVLTALAEDNEINVLSAPRVSVLNNQAAMINLTTRRPYVSWQMDQDDDGDNTVTPEVEFLDEGISLGITPQIGADGMVNLHVVPSVSKKTGDFNYTYQGDSYNVPIMKVRESSTLLRLPDGATAVVGGIIEEENTNNRTKVPMLGDIPGLGRLFASQEKSVEKTELVLMVSATIIER